MDQPRPRQIPINETRNRPYCIQREPKHQVLWAIAPVNGHYLFHSNAQVIHQPVTHPYDRLKKLFVTPCLAFEDEERVIGLFADLIFKHMVCEDTLVGHTVGHEVEHFLGGGETAAGIGNVVGYMVFRVEVGGEGSSCACSASEDRYYQMSVIRSSQFKSKFGAYTPC